MSPFKLGVHELPAAEVLLLRILMRLFAHDRPNRWIVADAPPYDAVLVDGCRADAPLAHARQLSPHVLRLTRISADAAPDTLARPLCADRLLQWLDRVESKVMRTIAPAPAAPALAPAEAPSLQPVRTLPSEPALPADAPRFGLRRWPRAAILRDQPGRVRMATLLSRRPLNAHDLRHLTDLPASDCLAFMRVLQAADLLVAPPPASLSAPAAGPGHATAQPPARTRPSFTQGLISGLRRRLGL